LDNLSHANWKLEDFSLLEIHASFVGDWNRSVMMKEIDFSRYEMLKQLG